MSKTPKLLSIGVTSHDVLENAPRGYCIVHANIQGASLLSIVEPTNFHVTGECNPYTNGRFVWLVTDPTTHLSIHPQPAPDLPENLDPIAHALKALFDALPPHGRAATLWDWLMIVPAR